MTKTLPLSSPKRANPYPEDLAASDAPKPKEEWREITSAQFDAMKVIEGAKIETNAHGNEFIYAGTVEVTHSGRTSRVPRLIATKRMLTDPPICRARVT